MLGVDVSEWDSADINDAVRQIADYLSKYSRNNDKDDHRPPVLSITQDATYIYDAFQLLNIDLDSEDIPYPRFMSLLRVIPDKAPLCRIVHLRQQIRDGKLTKEERREIGVVWGWDVINIRDKRKEAAGEDLFNEIQNRARAKKGLPPI
jgi:hypothetical protein